MGRRSSQSFVVDAFAYRRFDQITTRQKDAPCFVDDQRFVAHDGQICTASNTAPHDSRNLSDSHTAHQSIVSKNPSKMFFVGKNFVLHRKVYPGTVDQVNDGNFVFHRNFLGAQIFLCRNRKPGTRLDSCVIGNYNALLS